MALAAYKGARVKRKEDPRLITGSAQYTADLGLPGMRHVAFVRSPYAHARIGPIDGRAALAMPGVIKVVSGADLRQAYAPMPMSLGGDGLPDGAEPATRFALAVDRVRHVGEIVAAVVAETPAIAADAVGLVQVAYEPLPVVATPEAALAPNAPCLFAGWPDNVEHVWARKVGDPDAVFANAHRVITLKMNNQRVAGVSLETRAVVTAPDPATHGLTAWTSNQGAHIVRDGLAATLRLPTNAVRVITPDVGGGFGIKINLYPEEVVLSALTLRDHVPHKWVETRSEHLLATTHGRGQTAELTAAVDARGEMQALRMRVIADIGAYANDAGVANLTGLMAAGPYQVQHLDLHITGVFTNTTPVAAYRGAGRPEAAYYLERLMDHVAAELGLDPAAVRRVNFIPPEAFPYQSPSGYCYDSGEYEKALDHALDLSGYAALRAEQARRRVEDPSGPLLGIGLASYVEVCAFGPFESALVRVEPTGTVTVYTGISPHGQGQATTFAQLIADSLGVSLDAVQVRWGDTALVPQGNGTMGSRGLAVGGPAVVRAADKVRAKALRIAAHMLEAAVDDLEFADGSYRVKGVPGKALPLAEIAARAYTADLPDEVDPGLEATDFFKPTGETFPFGTHVAVVEVDRETGEVSVRDVFTADDCGPRISPLLAEGQVHGGLAQGIAQALMEEVVFSPDGQPITASLLEYAVPKAEHLPMFTTGATVTPTDRNPLGVKGIGEAATIGSTPAIVNAVIDALRPLGVTALDMPLRPERIWRAIRAGEAKKE